MSNAERFEEFVLQLDHVVVVVMWKLPLKAVARFARIAVTNVVGNDDEVSARVEQSAGLEQHVREMVVDKLLRRTAGAVKDQHRISRPRCTKGRVMDSNFGERFAVVKSEILDDEVATARGSCKQEQ